MLGGYIPKMREMYQYPCTSCKKHIFSYLPPNEGRECGECRLTGKTKKNTKYNRECKGVVIDVYDVLKAFEVSDPALQHLIKKALCVGLRGHKSREEDLKDILSSAIRAVELNKEQ